MSYDRIGKAVVALFCFLWILAIVSTAGILTLIGWLVFR